MKRKALCIGFGLAVLGAMVLPAAAMAETVHSVPNRGAGGPPFAINTLWVFIAAVLVIFMQAGFAFLEIGFSRGKNAGTIVAKVLTNFSIAAICYYAVGFAFAFGTGGESGGITNLIGTHGFLLTGVGDQTVTFGAMGFSNAGIEAKWLFQFSFCAVSLAIVWGTTLERIKFGVYIIYSIVFASLIYPIGSHWVFGGGWLQANLGMQDFAGSTAVHLIGATGGLAVLLLLGPRKGKYGPDGKPRAIPGHNMPLFGLACFILLVGWFGFNPGSGLGAIDGRFAEIAFVTLLGAAGGVLGALPVGLLKQRTIDIGMVGNGLIAGLVAITAPSGYVEAWTAIPIGLLAGAIVVFGVFLIDKKLDDPVGALSAHGLAGIWGTIACGIFTNPDLAGFNAVGVCKTETADGCQEYWGGLIYGGGFHQMWAQIVGVVVVFAFVLVASLITFALIKATYGLRVSEAEEDAGLDIVEHGMYGYPEQFIPASELVGSGLPGSSSHASISLSNSISSDKSSGTPAESLV